MLVKLKILYLTEFLSATGGGGEVVFCDLASEMARKGHTVHIICHQSQDDTWRISDSIRTPVVHRIKPPVNLQHGYFPSAIQQIQYVLNLIVKGYRLVKQQNFDIIHANTLSPAIAGSILFRVFRIPLVITVHHVHALQDKNNQLCPKDYQRRNRFAITSHHQLSRLICERIIFNLPADVLHAVSNAIRDDLIRFGTRTRIVTISNGIPLQTRSE